MSKKFLTVKQFVEKHKIRMKCKPSDKPNRFMDKPGFTHFKCTLFCKLSQMTLLFSQGPAHTSPPSIEDVLNCLALDSSGYDNSNGIEDWANNYGYDLEKFHVNEDHHVSPLKIYYTVEKQRNEFNNLLGDDLYQELLYGTESL